MRIHTRELLAVGIFGSSSRLRERIELLCRARNSSPRASARIIAIGAACLAGLLLATAVAPRWIAFAQAQPPRFEVASIKPGNPVERGMGVGVRTNRFIATNATLKMLIEEAYNLRDHQVQGGPNWLDSARFTIEAAPPAPFPGTPDVMNVLRPMIQTLLQERFRLQAHSESRIEPIYDLVVAKGGHRLKDPKPDASGNQGIFGTTRSDMNGYMASMLELSNVLSQRLGRSVVDRTGLAGKFDFKLIWTPGPGEGGSDIPPGTAAAGDGGPSIFTAIQEQLGLRLESSRGPVDVLVVDRAEKPDAN